MADEEKPKEDMESRLAALEAELKAEREGRQQDRQRSEMLETTLRALGTQRAPAQESSSQPSYGMVPVSPEDIRFLKSLYPDATDDALITYARQRQAELAYFARPLTQQVFGALGQAADILDRHDVLTDDDIVKDYKPNKKEIEALRQEYLDAGRPVPRRAELTQIVKARKVPELVEAETQRRMKEEQDRRASAASATTEAGTVGSSRPSVAAAPKKPLSSMSDAERNSALDGMSREDRIKALEGEIADTPLP